MPGNANFAASHTRGKYIGLLHHDDIYRSDLLARWVGVAERNENVGFVFNEYNNVNLSHRRTHRNEGRDFTECMDGDVFLEDVFFGNRWGSPVRGTALVRRSCWEKVGGMREKFDLLADVDLWMRLANRWDVGYVDEPVITIRQDRPVSYPDQYKSGNFSWKRRRILYNIHKENVRLHYRRRIEHIIHKARLIIEVNYDIIWWSFNSIVNNQTNVIKEINENKTGLELLPISLILSAIIKITKSF
jgi:GT2 family glycosyltransferase